MASSSVQTAAMLAWANIAAVCSELLCVKSNVMETGSVRVFVVGEKVVEDSQGGFKVQVDDIWGKYKKRLK